MITNSTALISIVVPCYNQAQYLDECLQSVLDQTYQNWECIIVNDGSPDNTEEVTLIWTQKDSRFKYLKKENGGLSSARNAGIDIANGEWILPLDADDRIGSEYLKFAHVEFKNQYDLIYCNAEKFGEEIGPWQLPTFSLKQLAQTNIIFCTVFFKRNDALKIGGYDESMKAGLEDWEFLIRLLKNNGRVLKLEYTGFYYRIKSYSMITEIETMQKKEPILKYIEKKHLDFFHEHLGCIHFLSYNALKLEIKNKEIENLTKRLKSKRYQFVDRLLAFFNI